jgi:flagellar basal-body rod modification protein FlgD
MTQINGTSGTTLAPTTSATSSALGGQTTSKQIDPLLDKNAFLKLMMTQLQNQDPLNPSDPSQYLGQLAQMTTVEQETNIANSTAQAAAAQADNTSLALLGHTVTYTDAGGNSVSGVVQKVSFSGNGPTLTVAGVAGIDPSSVNEVS